MSKRKQQPAKPSNGLDEATDASYAQDDMATDSVTTDSSDSSSEETPSSDQIPEPSNAEMEELRRFWRRSPQVPLVPVEQFYSHLSQPQRELVATLRSVSGKIADILRDAIVDLPEETLPDSPSFLSAKTLLDQIDISYNAMPADPLLIPTEVVTAFTSALLIVTNDDVLAYVRDRDSFSEPELINKLAQCLADYNQVGELPHNFSMLSTQLEFFKFIKP